MVMEIQQTIRSFYQGLSQSEKKIADFLLHNREQAAYLSIQELSKQVELSTATLSRFAKRIGYTSYQELKIALSMPSVTDNQELFSNLSLHDDSLTIAQKVFSANIRSLEDTKQCLEKEKLDASLSLLKQSNNVAFFGLGGSQIIALDAYHKFMRTSLTCEFQTDYHIQLMYAAKLTQTDCAVVISHTGRNQQMLQLCELLQENHVPIICITSYAGSPLAQCSTIALIAVAEETTYRSEAMSAMQAQLSLVDCLFMLYSLDNYKENSDIRTKVRQAIRTTRV